MADRDDSHGVKCSPEMGLAPNGDVVCVAMSCGWTFEVSARSSIGKVTGVALADQLRCLDWHSRNASKFAAVTTQCALDEVEVDLGQASSGPSFRTGATVQHP